MPKSKSSGTRMERIRGDNAYMARLQDFITAIKRGMEVELFTISDLAREAGVSDGAIRNLLNGKTLAPQLPTIEWLLRAVGKSIGIEVPRPKRKRRSK